MYDMPTEIDVKADGGLRIITLNRPDDLNAVNDALHVGLAKIWEVATTTVRADLTGHEGKVVRVAISADGKSIATGGEDRTVRLWSTKDGAPLGTLSGHSGALTALAFAPDGKTLASGSPDTTIRLWDIAAKRPLRTLEGHDLAVNGLRGASVHDKSISARRKDILDGRIR